MESTSSVKPTRKLRVVTLDPDEAKTQQLKLFDCGILRIPRGLNDETVIAIVGAFKEKMNTNKNGSRQNTFKVHENRF